MGGLGDSIGAYAQPLINQTDGSMEQVDKALSLAMICWNLATIPDAQHDEFLADMREGLQMDDEMFRAFRRDLIDPMIRRHREMFPAQDPTRRQMLRNTQPTR